MLSLSRSAHYFTLFVLSSILFTMPNLTLAQDKNPSSNKTSVNAIYSSDFLSNLRGGKESGSAYLDFATIELRHHVDLKEDQQLTYFVSGIYANGAEFSTKKSGDIQGASGIETGINLKRVHEAYMQYSNKSHSVLMGLYDTNTEFDVIESANLFVNAAYGMGNTLGSSGTNGPSTYPFPGLSLRYQYANEKLSFRFVVTDGVPGDSQHPDAAGLDLSSDEGYLNIAELDYANENTKWLIGAWQYSKNTLRDDLPSEQNNTGLYLRVEHQFQMFDGLTGFARIGSGSDDLNAFSRFYSAGVVKTDLISSRPDDTLGLAFAYAERSTAFHSADDVQNLSDGELNIELTYLAKLTEYVSLQPTFQWISKPSGQAVATAHVIGLRTILSF